MEPTAATHAALVSLVAQWVWAVHCIGGYGKVGGADTEHWHHATASGKTMHASIRAATAGAAAEIWSK